MSFLKENIGVILFCLFVLVLFGSLIYSVILDIILDSLIPSYGFVVSKSTTYGIFDDYLPRVEIGFDVVYKGKVYSRSKKFQVSSDQYYNISYGDVVFFDDNNEPIWEVWR